MRLRVLGSFELVAAGEDTVGAPVLMSSPRVRRLLAALTVHADSVVSVDRLADVVWGDTQPANVDSAMHSLVSRLRAILRVADTYSAGDDDSITVLTRPPGYLLRLGPECLDARRFALLAQQARSVLATSPSEAAQTLDEALGLWRGPAYAEFVDEDFARAEAAKLEELRTTAAEDRVEAALLLGRADEAVARAEVLVAEHPLRERPHAQLMLALYRTARQADALAVYRRYRARLDDDLGLDPSADLQVLEGRMLRQDPALYLAPAGPTAEPQDADHQEGSPADPATPVGNAPPPARRLVGRDEDVAGVARTLRSARVVTLTGPGGVGKTSLAFHVAALAQPDAPFRDGVWVVELASVAASEAVADAVTTVLSVQQHHGRAVVQRLVEYLRPKRLLLVLDNCEHVVGAAAEVVDALVRGCPHVVVLATSREPLGVDGEHVRPVAPLPLPSSLSVQPDLVARSPAVELFTERAAAASAGFVLDEVNAAAVGELCRRLDGLPLGIELAASRMRSMSPGDVVERLSSPFRFLRSSSRHAAERHRTMRAVVDWSYGLLDPLERRVFDRLGVFAGAFTVDAAVGAVADGLAGSQPLDAAEVSDVLSGLVDKSMVMVADDPQRTGATRYLLLETLRTFARERLAEAGETYATRRAHALYHVDVTERAADGVRGRDPLPSVQSVAGVWDDLRLAHAWALENDPDIAIRLVAALADYAETQMAPEVFVWADRTVETASARGSQHPLLTVVYATAAGGARFSSDLDRAEVLADVGARLLPDVTDPRRRFALGIRAEVDLFRGRLEACEATAKEAETLARRAGDSLRSTSSALSRALLLAYSGQRAQALALVEQIRDDADRSGQPFAMAWARYGEAEVRLDEDPDRAGVLLEDALARANAVGDRYLAGVARVSAASLRVRHGDPDRARALFREVIEHWQQAGNWTQQWTTLRNVVELLVRLHRDEFAAQLHGVVTSRANAAPVFGDDAERLDRARGTLTERLGPVGFAAATAVGAALDNDEAVARACAALEDAVASQPQRAPTLGGLPSGTRTDLFGREADLARLIDCLTSERVVTVTGTGGVGKTRVAVEAAARVASAGWRTAFLDLAALRREEDVASSLATLLGVRPGAGQSPADAAADFLSGHRLTLLVVDNCEHVLPAARRLIDRLLHAAPGLTVLATSRVRLGLAAEVTVPLEPLTVGTPGTSSAVDMFLDRARRVRPGLGDSDEELDLVTALCRRLDGLPLALELAAGRLGALGLGDLVERLDGALDVLGTADTDERHENLRMLIGWSYGLLDTPARQMFVRLAVFDGGFTLDAAEEVTGGAAGTLARLVDTSMVAVDQTAGGSRLRYYLLDTLRAYAAERLGAESDVAEVASRHTAWVVRFAETAERGLRTADEGAWVERMRAEQANIRGGWQRAFETGDIDSAARIVLAMRSYVAWRWSGQSELYERTQALLEAPGLEDSAHAAAVYGIAAEAAFARGELERAEMLGYQGLELSAWSSTGRWRCMYSLGLVAYVRGDAATTERWWFEVADSEEAPTSERISNRANVVLPRLLAGNLDGARSVLEPFQRFADDTGWPSAMAWAAYLDAEISRAAGDSAAAITGLRTAVHWSRSAGATFIEGLAATSLVFVLASDDVDAALDLLPSVLRHWQRAGTWSQSWAALRRLAGMLTELDLDLDEPAAALFAAAERAEEAPVPGEAEAARLAALRQRLCDRLGTEAYRDAEARGGALPRAAVMQEALDLIDVVRQSRSRATTDRAQ